MFHLPALIFLHPLFEHAMRHPIVPFSGAYFAFMIPFLMVNLFLGIVWEPLHGWVRERWGDADAEGGDKRTVKRAHH